MTTQPEVLRRINDYSYVVSAEGEIEVGEEVTLSVEDGEISAMIIDTDDDRAVAESIEPDFKTYA